MENFWRFAPSEALFCTIFCKKTENLKYVMKIFNGTGVKKQGRNWHIVVPGGGKNWNFWPKYSPLIWSMLGLQLNLVFLKSAILTLKSGNWIISFIITFAGQFSFLDSRICMLLDLQDWSSVYKEIDGILWNWYFLKIRPEDTKDSHP